MVVSVLELPDYQIEAETKEEAIASIHHQLSERFQNADVTVLELSIAIAPNTNASTNANTSNNPGTKLFGLYKDDPDFAEISAAIRAEREADDDTEVDPSMYLREKV
ncbi:MAG: hypothetical protein MUF49_02895 [Oculatellaceae cyanobacterium Prado106]|nr:hypothetical protein [Oculatellaceae cyanobacterium Prado106]